MMLLLAFVLLQSPDGPTVGDTVWIERAVRLPAGATLRPRPIESSELLDPLAPPTVVLRGADVVVRYPVVFWRPGDHQVTIPGPIAVRPDGWSDTLAASRAQVVVASVLPNTVPDSIPPEPPAELVVRLERSTQPVLVLLLLAGLALVPLHRWWRRRGPVVARPPETVPAAPADRLEMWLAAGEYRAVLDEWRMRVRQLAASPERDELVAALDDARYGFANPEVTTRLHRAASDLTEAGSP